VVAVNAKGVSDFGALQDALSTSGATADLLYYAFDPRLPRWLRPATLRLEDRKAMLATRLVGAPSRIHYSEHHTGDGPAFFKSACGMQLEGIVSKRRSSPYETGRARAGSRRSACIGRSS